MSYSIGQKLKLYRERRGISQIDLEVAIGASFGSISRIENDKVNPTKETIIHISKFLGILTVEIADLFGIDTSNDYHLLQLISKLHKFEHEGLLFKFIVNELTFHLGYLASFILIKDKSILKCVALTENNISAATSRILSKYLKVNFTDISIDTAKYPEHIFSRVVNTELYEECNLTSDFASPIIPKIFADMMQKATGDKKYGIFPISIKNITYGVLVLVKKIDEDFESESKILYSIGEQIGLALASL